MSASTATVGDALRWIRKLKAMESEGAQVIYLKHILAAEREACAKIAENIYADVFIDDDSSTKYRNGCKDAAEITAAKIRGHE